MRYHPDFTKDVAPDSKVDLLDRGRAEIYINMFLILPSTSDADLRRFVGGLFSASRGDPDVKALLLKKPFDVPDADAKALCAHFKDLWDEFEAAPPAIDGLKTLRDFCARHPRWWPESMIIALFDDPSFDAVAYLDWHNSPD
jgi:hypothetical protein